MPSKPSSGSGPYSLLDQLAEEFANRYWRGERPSMSEYVDRYPELAEEISALFPTLAELGQAATELLNSAPDPGLQPTLRRLGDYRIVREVGRGGMGVVYEADQVSLNRRVALKILSRSDAGDGVAIGRFRREASSAARLHHTNIVPVYEIGEEGEVFYYTMQLIRGQGLDSVINELRLLRKATSSDRAAREASPPVIERPSAVDKPLTRNSSATTPREEDASSIAERLLSGRFTPEVLTIETVEERPSLGRDEFAETIPSANHPASAGRSGPNSFDSVQLKSRQPRLASWEITPSGLTSLSGGSTVESGGRDYFRRVAHIGRQAAQALGYAHVRGIIHRDVKPSNVLLDVEGVAWISDFGLAKAEDDDLTQSGDIVGTLRYIAPERFHGKVDGRSDVYALGLTLYELLTLRPAFDSSDRLCLIDLIKSEEPARPRSFDPRIPRDLEMIVTKAIDKDARRRYSTADEMAEDLRRFIDGEPIQARRISKTEKVWKWVKRRPSLAATLALLAASMITGTVLSTILAIRSNRYAEYAQERAMVAMVARRESQTAREKAESSEAAAQIQSAGLLLERALDLAGQGEIGPGLLGMLEALRVAPERSEDLQRTLRLNIAAWGRRLARIRWMAPSEPTTTLAISPDGRRIAISRADGLVQIHDSATGRPIGEPLGKLYQNKVPHMSMTYTPDGRLLVIPSDDSLQRYDAETLAPVGPPMRSLLGTGSISAFFAMRPDGRELLSISRKVREVHRFDLQTGACLNEGGRLAPVMHGEYLADGRFFSVSVTPANDNRIELSDPEALKTVAGPWGHRAPNEDPYSWRFWPNPDGRSYWLFSRPGWIQQFDMADGRPVGPPMTNRELRFFTESPGLNLPSGRGTLLVNGRLALAFLPERPAEVSPGSVNCSKLSGLAQDERWFASASGAGIVVSDFGDDWPVVLEQKAPPDQPRPHQYESATYSPDAELVLVTAHDSSSDVREAVICETRTNRPRGAGMQFRAGRFGYMFPKAVSADGRLIAAAHGLSIRVLDTRTGRPVGPLIRHTDTVSALAFSADGTIVVAGDFSQNVCFWNVKTGRSAGSTLTQPDVVVSLALSPNGKRLAVGTAGDRTGRPVLALWDLDTNTRVGPDFVHPHTVLTRFSADGARVVTSCHTGVRFFNAAIGAPIGGSHDFPGEDLQPDNVAVSPSSSLVLVGTSAGRARLFDSSTGASIAGKVFDHPLQVPVRTQTLSPDGRWALIGYSDGTAQLWDIATARQVGPPLRVGREVIGVAFTPDGLLAMATSSRGRTLRRPVPKPIDTGIDVLALKLETDTGMRLESRSSPIALTPGEWNDRKQQLRQLGEGFDAPLAPRPDAAQWYGYRAFEAEGGGAVVPALWYMEQFVTRVPGDGDLLARLGCLRAAAGRFEQASDAFDEADQKIGRQAVQNWCRRAASEAIAEGHDQTALWLLDRCLTYDPSDAESLADRANLLERAGKTAAARADRDRVESLRADADLLASLADRLAVEGRWERARALYTRAFEVTPPTYLASRQAALTLRRLGDIESFHALVDLILEFQDFSPNPPLWVCQNLRACVLGPSAPDQAARLARLTESAVARMRGRPEMSSGWKHEVLSTAGAALYRAGRHEEVVPRIEEGIAVDRGNRLPLDDAFLAMAHQALGHREAALACLDRLAAVKPSGDFWEDLEIQVLRDEAEAVARLDPAFPEDPFVAEW